jgi:hypothetical protein
MTFCFDVYIVNESMLIIISKKCEHSIYNSLTCNRFLAMDLCVFDHLSMVEGRRECPNLYAPATNPLLADGLMSLQRCVKIHPEDEI